MSVSKKVLSVGLAAVLAASMIPAVGVFAADEEIPTLDQIKVGEDYQDLKASIKVLTNRTDIVDTVYKGYAEEFMNMYPNIKVEYEGITDYEQSLELRLTTGDWGDLCFIPTSVDKSELSSYFTPLGDYDTLDQTYNFAQDKSYDGTVYGIANGGTASGIVYNKRVWKEAGIDELPATPDEFLDDLQTIKDKTDAIPLYTNFAARWPMGAWDAYIGVTATGDADYMNNTICHTKNPFAKQDDMTGPYAVYYTMYESVARGLVEDDPASSDWESSKTKMNSGEIAAMLYMKWLIEDSSIYEDEGSIPALKSGDLPDALADFEGVELLSDNPAKEGEETLFNEINSESEVGINNDDYPDCELLEAALYGSDTLDDMMDQWNEKWSDAQESLGVEVNE